MRIGAISLGCDKNRVDTEKMLARLVENGHTLVGNEQDADIIIINTCAFIDKAKEESIDEILSAISAKTSDVDGRKKVIVTGCLSQRYSTDLREEFPEVDAFLGIADYDGINAVIDSLSYGEKPCNCANMDAFYAGRVLTTPYHYAYLKIADGCNNHCTYCAIPAIRGKYRSEKQDDLLIEAKRLSDDGVKELILVAQDVTRYGTDFDGKSHLMQLVRELEKLDFEWIRLLYLEPEAVDDELIDFIVNEPKIVKYMDVPFQHIDSDILKRMNRHTNEEYTRELVAKIKARGITLRTSFICGFPSESEEAFAKLREFVRTAGIDYAGFFAYSREEGTPADKLQGHLPEDVKQARADELSALQAQLIAMRNKNMIGKVVQVRYDDIDYDKQMFVGRAQFQAPVIDNVVYFSSDRQINIGEVYEVRITDIDGIDFIGRTE